VTLRQELDGETIIESRTKGGYLRLDPQGFSAFSRRGEKRRTWDEVTGFLPTNVQGGTIHTVGAGPPIYQIGFFLRNPPKKGRIGRWVVRAINKVDDTLPGVYPNAVEVVELMERWRQRHSLQKAKET
jgi:hypothetical protein